MALELLSDDCLTITAATEHSVLFTRGTREYRASLRTPRHTCPPPAPQLGLYDRLAVDRHTSEGDVFAVGQCGCFYLVYNVVPIIAVRSSVHF